VKALVTGSTGLIGSYLVEALASRGVAVRALARRTSDLTLLTGQPAEICYGDVTDPLSLGAAVEGVDWVFHTAARMNDWGPWPVFEAQNVTDHRNVTTLSPTTWPNSNMPPGSYERYFDATTTAPGVSPTASGVRGHGSGWVATV